MKRSVPKFPTAGMPLFVCDSCSKSYQPWEVDQSVWQLLPKHLWRLSLCEDDFLALLKSTGHDTAGIAITHNAWDNLLAYRKEAEEIPQHHVKILIADPDFMPETLWCEALEECGDNQYRVRLISTSLGDPRMEYGTELLAVWNGSSYHRPTGRVLLKPMKVLKKKRRRRQALRSVPGMTR